MRISDWSSDVCSSDLDQTDDPVFIGLIGTMLKAGCMDDWKFERTYSGTPQGGVISPLLANIYLHELDQFMEEMRTGFDKGAERKANPAYTACSRQIAALRTEIDAIRATSADKRSEEHTSELQSLMRISYAVFCLNKKTTHNYPNITT